jgi:hypothetical protein
MAMHTRRSGLGLAMLLGGSLVLGVGTGCSGAPTRLVTVKSGAGQGPVQLEVKNLSDVPINNLFLAKSSQVTDQLDPDSPEGQAVWGPDLLPNAIAHGDRVPVPVAEPGRWDARVLDRDRRYQHVSGLKLDAGGRYILELNESGWRTK